jgi:hypothetical protein
VVLAEGGVATTMCAAAPPGFVPGDESEPHAAANMSAASIGNAKELRDSITLS